MWWSTVVWEVYSAPVPGWNYGLRVYNMIPRSSEIFERANRGDMAAVKRLFSSGEASLYDRDEDNNTILLVRPGFALLRTRAARAYFV